MVMKVTVLSKKKPPNYTNDNTDTCKVWAEGAGVTTILTAVDALGHAITTS